MSKTWQNLYLDAGHIFFVSGLKHSAVAFLNVDVCSFCSMQWPNTTSKLFFYRHGLSMYAARMHRVPIIMRLKPSEIILCARISKNVKSPPDCTHNRLHTSQLFSLHKNDAFSNLGHLGLFASILV